MNGHLRKCCLEPRANMSLIDKHTYIVGKVKISVVTEEQSNALGWPGLIKMLTQLFKDGVMYHSVNFSQRTKRET